jgi:hypothetical protein
MAIAALLLAAEAHGLGAIYLGGIRRPTVSAGPSTLRPICGITASSASAIRPTPRLSRIAARSTTCWILIAAPIPVRVFHADIRPHLWSLEQLADFRDSYFGTKDCILTDAHLHVDSDARFSPKFGT